MFEDSHRSYTFTIKSYSREGSRNMTIIGNCNVTDKKVKSIAELLTGKLVTFYCKSDLNIFSKNYIKRLLQIIEALLKKKRKLYSCSFKCKVSMGLCYSNQYLRLYSYSSSSFLSLNSLKYAKGPVDITQCQRHTCLSNPGGDMFIQGAT